MGILIVAAIATGIGFLLILLIGRNQPVSPAALDRTRQLHEGELDWVRAFGVEGFQRLLLTLFTEMGFHPERSERSANTVDLYANDPTPIKGGRLYVRGVLAAPGADLGDDEVRNLIEAARAEFVGKGVLVTLGHFTPEARDTAKGNPVDLVDGASLAKLMKKHLPQSYATRKV
jgi:restriction endonuclease Mrr